MELNDINNNTTESKIFDKTIIFQCGECNTVIFYSYNIDHIILNQEIVYIDSKTSSTSNDNYKKEKNQFKLIDKGIYIVVKQKTLDDNNEYNDIYNDDKIILEYDFDSIKPLDIQGIDDLLSVAHKCLSCNTILGYKVITYSSNTEYLYDTILFDSNLLLKLDISNNHCLYIDNYEKYIFEYYYCFNSKDKNNVTNKICKYNKKIDNFLIAISNMQHKACNLYSDIINIEKSLENKLNYNDC